MNITELRYLVAIMKWGSVSAAAKQLYAAQPNVSKALKNLEEEYGIRIFERSSTGMIPTEQGRHFIEQAERVLRELPFITALPAGAVLAAQGHEALPAAADAQVLVQGIADLVLVYPDHLELLDYKTDRRKAESDFLRAYRAQLNLYAIAIEKRFAPKKVTYKGIYSFALGKLIEA